MNSLGLEGRKPPFDLDAELLKQLAIHKAHGENKHELRQRIEENRLTAKELQNYVNDTEDNEGGEDSDLAKFPERLPEYVPPEIVNPVVEVGALDHLAAADANTVTQAFTF